LASPPFMLLLLLLFRPCIINALSLYLNRYKKKFQFLVY
jgi:hypothetical protein